MTLPEIRERFYKFVEQPKSSSEVADFYESELSKLIEGVDIERAAEAIHEAYLTTCKKLGWEVKPSNQVPYSELSEDSKELDRASVRATLAILTKVISDK